MFHRVLSYCMVCGVLAAGSAQELNLSVAARTYSAEEQIWVTVSVIDAAAMPGAYTVRVACNSEELGYSGSLPSSQGPFSVSPAVSENNGTVTVAGFQGITDTGSGTTSLVTLVYTPKQEQVTVDTASFTVSSSEVYSAQAAIMDLRLTKQTTSVRLAAPAAREGRVFSVTRSYIRFMVPREGRLSVRIFDMSGRVVAVPLRPTVLPSGFQAVPVGARLGSGIYIVSVKGAGLNMTKKLEVIR